MCTSKLVLEQLGDRCKGDHEHKTLIDGRPKAAAIYPPQLCRAIIRGIEAEKQKIGIVAPSGLLSSLEAGCALYNLEPEQVLLEEDPVGTLEHEDDAINQWYLDKTAGPYYDNMTGQKLPEKLVQAARGEEIEFMDTWGVWIPTPISTCWEKTGKGPLGGRWVDVNKGDDESPEVRCRYVAKDLALTKTDEFFAAMPPLEALRMILSYVASGRKHGRGGRKVLVIDARKAHIHAYPDRDIFVDLPPEIKAKYPGMCGWLRRMLYGTRDAPQRWEAYLASELEKLGFIRGKASACVFVHATRDLRCVVHGDDFIFGGDDNELTWIETQMHDSFLIKVIGKLGGMQAI
jgi:hypothetical protein